MQNVLTYQTRSVRSARDESLLETEPWLRASLEAIVRDYSPEMVWLFGSRAEGRHTDDSDYDLLVVVDAEDDDLPADTARAARHAAQAGRPLHLTLWPATAFERQKHSLISPAGAAFNRGILLYDRQAL